MRRLNTILRSTVTATAIVAPLRDSQERDGNGLSGNVSVPRQGVGPTTASRHHGGGQANHDGGNGGGQNGGGDH